MKPLSLLLASFAAAQPLANPALGGANFGFGGFCFGALVGGLTFWWAKSKGDYMRRREGKDGLGQAVTTGGAAAGLLLFYVLAFKL